MAGETRRRFSRAERWIHGTTAVLMIVCIATAAVLYNASMAIAVGNRHLIETAHVYCGFALPVPMVAGLVSRAYRTDLGRLNRFTPADWSWLRSSSRRDGSIRVGKFNAGQKLNGSLSAGAILVLLITGGVMYVTDLAPLAWRTGATFVHDWAALAVGLLVSGHTLYALRDREAMRGIRTGEVSTEWAQREHPAWVEELSAPDQS